jgi:Holliday junction resolvase RusA-like endonuclease
MQTIVSGRAVGIPQTKGSTRLVPTRRGVRVTADNPRLRAWSTAVGRTALDARARSGLSVPLSVAATVDLVFLLPRPQRTKRIDPDCRPDLDKLVRAVLDALTGVVWIDDGQVVALSARKTYARADEAPGVEFAVALMH